MISNYESINSFQNRNSFAIQTFWRYSHFLIFSYMRIKILSIVFLQLFLYYYEYFIFFLFAPTLLSSRFNFFCDKTDASLLYTIKFMIFFSLYLKLLDVLIYLIKNIFLLSFSTSLNLVLLSYEYLISLLRVSFIIDAG